MLTASIMTACSASAAETGSDGSSTGSTAPSTGSSSTTVPKPPASAPSPFDFDGKYGVSLTFPTAADGFATVGGFLDGETSVQPWIERTTDGGRSWRALSSPAAEGTLIFNTGRNGWSVGGRKRLLLTTDGGASWRALVVDGYVTSLTTAGNATWLIESRNDGSSETTCRSEVLVSIRLGEPPVPVASQPHLGDACGLQVVAGTSSIAYVVNGAATAAPASYVVTTDAGASWAERSTPCNRLADPQLSIAASGESVWLQCPYGQPLDTSEDRFAKGYRSTDAGDSWTPTTIAMGGADGNALAVATPAVAWTWGVLGNLGYLERTTDGGKTWTSMLTTTFGGDGADELSVRPPLRNVGFTVPKSFSTSGESAALVIETYPRASGRQAYAHLLVGVTGDDGATWQWGYLPNFAPRSGQPGK